MQYQMSEPHTLRRLSWTLFLELFTICFAVISLCGNAKAAETNSTAPFTATTSITGTNDVFKSGQGFGFTFATGTDGSVGSGKFNKGDKLIIKIKNINGLPCFDTNNVSFSSSSKSGTPEVTNKNSIFNYSVVSDSESDTTDIVLTPNQNLPQNGFYDQVNTASASVFLKPSSSVATSGAMGTTATAYLQKSGQTALTPFDTLNSVKFSIDNSSSNVNPPSTTTEISQQIFANSLGISFPGDYVYQNSDPKAYDNNGFADDPTGHAGTNKSIIYNYTQQAMVASAQITLPTELKSSDINWTISTDGNHVFGTPINSLHVYDSHLNLIKGLSVKASADNKQIQINGHLNGKGEANSDAGKTYTIAFAVRTDSTKGSMDNVVISSKVQAGDNQVQTNPFSAYLYYNSAGQTKFNPALSAQNLNMTPKEVLDYPFPMYDVKDLSGDGTITHQPAWYYPYSFAYVFWDHNDDSKPYVTYGNENFTDDQGNSISTLPDGNKGKTIKPGTYHNSVVVHDDNSGTESSQPVVLNVLGDVKVQYIDVDTGQVVSGSGGSYSIEPNPNVTDPSETNKIMQMRDLTSKATVPN